MVRALFIPEIAIQHAQIQLRPLFDAHNGTGYRLNVKKAEIRIGWSCHSVQAKSGCSIAEMGGGPQNARISGQTAGHVEEAGRGTANWKVYRYKSNLNNIPTFLNAAVEVGRAFGVAKALGTLGGHVQKGICLGVAENGNARSGCRVTLLQIE